MWNLIQKGGPVMWPIIMCSIMAFAIFIERMYNLHRAKIDTEDFMNKITNT